MISVVRKYVGYHFCYSKTGVMQMKQSAKKTGIIKYNKIMAIMAIAFISLNLIEADENDATISIGDGEIDELGFIVDTKYSTLSSLKADCQQIGASQDKQELFYCDDTQESQIENTTNEDYYDND
jgi:hypothetical protein